MAEGCEAAVGGYALKAARATSVYPTFPTSRAEVPPYGA
jgi:hypothetical protein